MTQLFRAPLTIGRFLFGACLFFCLVSCERENDHRSVKDFYFPLERLEKGLVYEYHSVGEDTLAPYYQSFRSLKIKDTVFLISMQYDAELNPRQFSREEEVNNGMLLTDSRIYFSDNASKERTIPVEIQSGSMFPFKVAEEGGIFLYKVRWFEGPDSSRHNTVIRNRRFSGDTSGFSFKGQPQETIAFSVHELIENYDEGYLEQEFSGTEIYARGLGLLFYRKEITPEFTMAYQLVDTFAMQELEDRLMIRLEPEDK